MPGDVIETADEALRKHYETNPLFKETRYFPRNGKRMSVGFGARLNADREALERVAAVLLQLDDAITSQEAEAASQPRLKF